LSVSHPKLDRRSLLLGAIFLVGGAAALTRFTRNLSSRGAASGLDSDDLALLEQISDVIIPATDSPGAIGAGVPEFIRTMLAEWSSAQTRAEIVSVLRAVEKRAWEKFGAGFLELPPERKLDVVAEYDAGAIAAQDPAYGKFKFLVLLGYYQSEAGATQELRFELVPGAWRSCLPLTEVGRASAV
jgi:gluconate 2-dehydrogenase gamma chain